MVTAVVVSPDVVGRKVHVRDWVPGLGYVTVHTGFLPVNDFDLGAVEAALWEAGFTVVSPWEEYKQQQFADVVYRDLTND